MSTSTPGLSCPPSPFREADEGQPYGRTLISEADDTHELLAMRWRPGVRCAPHDHGDSSGTIHIIEGEFVERRFRFEEGALRVVATQTHKAPALLRLTAKVIHDMVAPDGGLSIHRYATAITGMRVWDVAEEQVLVVRDDCGAWVPADRTQIVSCQPWSMLP